MALRRCIAQAGPSKAHSAVRPAGEKPVRGDLQAGDGHGGGVLGLGALLGGMFTAEEKRRGATPLHEVSLLNHLRSRQEFTSRNLCGFKEMRGNKTR
eukprot:scaffold7773_cov45-Prasinocladus_malaysianus.AAC.1